MYLLTLGWCLARTSLAMRPEQSVTSGENLFLRSARSVYIKGPRNIHCQHVHLITQSPSVTVVVTEPAQTPAVPAARQNQMVALLNWQEMKPHAKFRINCDFAVHMGTSR